MIPKPVLFLDIDGVLNTFGSQPGGGILGLSAAHVARLKRILDTVPCDVVLSSTWRILGHTLKKAEQMMESIGHEFISLTPSGKRTEGGIWTSIKRGDEIKEWITRYRPEHFVVLDDDVYPDEFPDANQVHTDGFDGGLTDEKAEEVIRKLRP